MRHGPEDQLLHLAHVLILIDQDLRVAFGDLTRERRRIAVVIREELRREMLQIGKVHERAAALFGSVARAELQRQPQQALHRGRGGAQVAKHFFGRFRVLHPKLLHGLLAQVAPRLDLVFQVRVGRIADGFQARERNVRQRLPGLVPALQGRARDGAQSGGGLRNAFAVGGHEPLGAGLRHALQQPLQLACPVGGGLARLRKQFLPPNGLARVGHALQTQPAGRAWHCILS